MDVSIIALAFLSCLAPRPQDAGAEDPLEIRLGEAVDGVLSPQDSTFSSPALAQYPFHGEQVPADRYWLIHLK